MHVLHLHVGYGPLCGLWVSRFVVEEYPAVCWLDIEFCQDGTSGSNGDASVQKRNGVGSRSPGVVHTHTDGGTEPVEVLVELSWRSCCHTQKMSSM